MTTTLGRLAVEVWQRVLLVYTGLRGRPAGAEASWIRRQYVFGAVGRKVFEAAIRQRRRRGLRT